MNYEFFASSEKAWKEMYGAILNAQKSVYLEMYIFQGDMTKLNFFDLLIEKAKQGLKVKLVLDSFGSVDLSDKTIFEFKKAGVEILFLSYFMHRTHRKILVIDESVAFIGGVNIHKIAKFWDDLVVKIKGKLVKNIIKSFSKTYKEAGGSDTEILKLSKNSYPLTQKDVWLIEHSPVKRKFGLKKVYKTYLNKAEKNITLITPYFMPKRWLRAVLHQAVLRGVKVEILVPQKTDYFFIDRVNYFYIYELSRLGVNFYLEPKMNHAKVMIIDNNKGLIGSQNLDLLSFDYNSEIGVFFEDPKIISELSKITDGWKKESLFFDHHSYKPKWFDYILSPFIKLFFKIF